MNNTYYPDIDHAWVLPFRLVFDGLRGDPLWLERPDCPYDETTREALRSLWGTQRAIRENVMKPVLPEGADKWDQLDAEMTELFNELRTFSTTMDITDVKERMAYFRTATSLLDKLTGLGERIHNVKAVSDFRTKILSVFDEVLTPEQRTSAMEKLIS